MTHNNDPLAVVVEAWTALNRYGDTNALERAFDEHIVWQGCALNSWVRSW